MTYKIKALAIAFVVAIALGSRAEAADLTVGSGKTYATVQAAINAAVSGDRVMIDPGTYNECITLPNKGTLASPIIIRSATADVNLPAAGVRLSNGTEASPTPPTSYAAVMPVLHAPNNGCAAIELAPGARDYTIGPGLKITGPTAGYRSAMEIGLNTSSFQFEADQPRNIIVDRNWITSDNTWYGLKVGIDINGANITISNNFINDIKGVGQDAMATRCINGTGPITIYNNFLEGSGYPFICGGDEPNMMTYADITAATTTQATLVVTKPGHTIATLRVGQRISFLANGGTARHSAKVVSCGTSTPNATCTSSTVTYEAIPSAPDVGTGTQTRAQWGAIPSDITFRRNYVRKNPAWMNNILETPVISSATPSTTAGSLVAGTYYYKVQATYCCYQASRVYSTAASQVTATLSATGQVTLNWGAVSGPSSGLTYRVFRSTTSGTFAGYIDVGNVTSYVDTGASLTGTSAPSGGTDWLMKNIFEVKFARRLQVDSNFFEYSPPGGEAGYAFWIKSNAYDDRYFMYNEDTTIEKNIIKSVDGCFSILGRIDSTAANLARMITNLTIRNNICFDSNSDWMQGKSSVFAIKVQSPVDGLTIDNNTFIHKMASFFYADHTNTAGSVPTINNFSFRNNMWLKGAYGFFGEGCSAGNATECFTEFVTGTSPFLGNVAGGSTVGQPAGNTTIALTEFEGPSHFENYPVGGKGGTAADFALKSTSTLKGTANGGGDPGANIALILQATSGVRLGTLEGSGGGVTPPSINNASPLPSGTQGASYSQTLTASNGTSPYTWAVTSGSLPTGITLGASGASAGLLSGTPTVSGTFNFTARVTDSTAPTALTASKAFALTIAPSSATLNITTTTLAASEVAAIVDVQLQVAGGTSPYTWRVNTGSTLPTWLTLDDTGRLSGVPEAVGTYNFTVKVTDAAAATDTQALSLVVNKESMACARSLRYRVGGLTIENSHFRRTTQPTASAPDCAMKGDRWTNIATGERWTAINTNPLTWSLDTGGATTGNVVSLDTSDQPSENSIIIGTSSGGFTLAQLEDIPIDASQIATGTIDPARLPASSVASWQPITVTIVAGNTQTSNVPVGGGEVLNTTTANARFRHAVDTQGFTQVAIYASIATTCAGTNDNVRLEYWTGSAWADSGAGTIDCGAVGTKDGTFGTLAVGARAPRTVFRLYYEDGDGTTDPTIVGASVTFRP